MNKPLENITREQKIGFLKKLQSGKYSLSQVYEPQPLLNFRKQPDGLFKCLQEGRIMNAEQISALPGYKSIKAVEIVSGKSLSDFDSIKLTPLKEAEYIDSLLINKDAILLSYDGIDPEKPFRCNKTGRLYSFVDLSRSWADNNSVFLLNDEVTAGKFLQELENFC